MSLLAVKGSIYAHDPVIVKEKEYYYRFQTGDLLPVFRSKDLLQWEQIYTVFSKNPEWCSKQIPGSTSLWAPEVVYRNNEWHIYYSVSTFGKNRSCIGLVISKTLNHDSSEYKWVDKGFVLLSTEKDDFNAIDPAVEQDQDNHDWLLWGSFWSGLKMQRLDNNGFLMKNTPVISVASRMTDPNPVEGGYILKHKNFYYLFASHDFCCRGTASSYHIVIGRSELITGPYIDKDGIALMESGGTTLRDGFSYERWAGPGHNSIFVENNKYYMVYHAYDRNNNGIPMLMIESFEWDDKNWPVFVK